MSIARQPLSARCRQGRWQGDAMAHSGMRQPFEKSPDLECTLVRSRQIASDRAGSRRIALDCAGSRWIALDRAKIFKSPLPPSLPGPRPRGVCSPSRHGTWRGPVRHQPPAAPAAAAATHMRWDRAQREGKFGK